MIFPLVYSAAGEKILAIRDHQNVSKMDNLLLWWQPDLARYLRNSFLCTNPESFILFVVLLYSLARYINLNTAYAYMIIPKECTVYLIIKDNDYDGGGGGGVPKSFVPKLQYPCIICA